MILSQAEFWEPLIEFSRSVFFGWITAVAMKMPAAGTAGLLFPWFAPIAESSASIALFGSRDAGRIGLFFERLAGEVIERERQQRKCQY